jgi:hypothetical protein
MLMSAPRRVSVEAMMTLMSGLAASSLGSAVNPSMTGISISRMTTSTSLRWSTASAALPLLADATTATSGSVSSARMSRPRMAALSSTTIRR